MLLLQQQILNCLKVALFFGTFKLHIEVRLWLRYFLSCHCEMLCIMWQLHFSRSLKNVFLITLEIRYLPGRFNYVQKYDTVSLCVVSSFWYVCITYWNYFRLPLPLRHNYVIYLFKVFFWWRHNYVELRKLLECLNCVWKLCYKMVILVALFFYFTNFLMMLIFLIMLPLLWYVCTKYGNK